MIQRGCILHGFHREPRRDGIGAPAGNIGRTDLPLEQTYTPDGTDPDAAGGSPTVELPVELGLSPGLLHMHGQLGGVLSALVDGTRSVGAADSDCALGRQFLRTQPAHEPRAAHRLRRGARGRAPTAFTGTARTSRGIPGRP